MKPVTFSASANRRAAASGRAVSVALMGPTYRCWSMAVVVASRHVSDAALESTRRRLTAKQADTVDRLERAAVDLLNRDGFSGLTVRRVAAEAGVGAATAYTYFSSKEHLVAEVFWRRLAGAAPAPHESDDRATRVIDVLSHIALLVAD